MKEHTGHNPGYVDSCDYGFLARRISGQSHPRDECYSRPVYIAKAADSEAFSCIDHFRSVTQMMLELYAGKEVIVRLYRAGEGT